MEIVIAMEIVQMAVMNLTVWTMFALTQNGNVLMVLHVFQNLTFVEEHLIVLTVQMKIHLSVRIGHVLLATGSVSLCHEWNQYREHHIFSVENFEQF